jgi:predicted GNAT superfamily acetyltransferase
MGKVAPNSNTGTIVVRQCTSHAEYRACVDLQVAVWKFAPIDIVSSHIFAVAAETGGQILGAFDNGRMVGFVLSFAANRKGKSHLHSHMLAVLPEYQNHGVGRSLKLAQREEALSRGIDHIEWTFDPMQTLNAYFNIEKLGAVIRRYIPDFYGSSSSPLHAALPTDRVVAEWNLKSRRVCVSLAGEPHDESSQMAIPIPRNIDGLREQQTAVALAQQAQVRSKFLDSFERGCVVTGFKITDAEGKYLLREDYED